MLSEKTVASQSVYTVGRGSYVMGYVVIDSTIGGSSRGGLRMHPDVSEEEVCELARTMTLKCGFAGQPQGGAKAGIRCDPEAPLAERRRCLAEFGQAIAPLLLDRTYIPGTDMGTIHADIRYLLQTVGIPLKRRELTEIDTGKYTAVTVFEAAKQAASFLAMRLPERSVAIEGFGKVGGALANLFDGAGSRVVAVSTAAGALYNPKGLDIKRLNHLASKAGSRVVEVYADADRVASDALIKLPVDILCPCAGSHSVNLDNVLQVAARIVCSGANNAVTAEAERMLFERGVLHPPDFVTNVGGVLGGAMEFSSISEREIVSLLERFIGRRVAWLLTEAARQQTVPSHIAAVEARKRFEEMRRATDDPSLLLRLRHKAAEFHARGWLPARLVAAWSRSDFERRLTWHDTNGSTVI